MKAENGSVQRLLFWAIFLFAAVVRLKDLSTGLPLHTLYGENDSLRILVRMLETGNLNPGHYDLPALAYYIYLPFLYFFYLTGKVFGYFPDLGSVPGTSFIFVGRAVCAIFGTATVYAIYRIGKRYSTSVALLAMGILAAAPQHIEFSHMLRPEIPAIFFVLLAVESALSILHLPSRKAYRWFGLWAGVSFSIKYTIGLPLLGVLILAHWARRRQAGPIWFVQSLLIFLFVFVSTNPFLITDQQILAYWSGRIQSMYVPGEDYYGKNIFYYYLEYLSRYNFNLPILLFAGLGLIWSVVKQSPGGVVIAIYPLAVFLWLCSFETRRVHGLLPIHPFLAMWAAITLDQIWQITKALSRALIFRIAYILLLCVILFWPYYRTGVQAYLFSRFDNRSKAELWMTNRLPRGSRIAVLQFQQIELDPFYFQIEDFYPKDYVLQNRDFSWFRDQGFDYIVVSSGQYMRYFTEGESASKYKDYFLHLFQDGAEKGTLILDLLTHPLLIPDYRIKVFSTRRMHSTSSFLPAIDGEQGVKKYHLKESGTILFLSPGYYSLEFLLQQVDAFSVRVRNLKLQETILQKKENGGLSAAEMHARYPFAIFPVMESSRFTLFYPSRAEMIPDQEVQFSWRDIPTGLNLEGIRPAIEVVRVGLSRQYPHDSSEPYLRLSKKETCLLSCTLRNAGNVTVNGYVEAFLSEIGQPQPWKDFEQSSDLQEFFLEAGQTINIDIPINTGTLTGDHQLSYWIFTRQDLPFSPQNGGWFNKQIRVQDPKLGIHPIYGIEIP